MSERVLPMCPVYTASQKWHPHGGEDIEFLLLLWGSFWFLISDFWHRCMVIILWKDMSRSRGMSNTMWRYGLTANRPAATSGRCRGEALRCVATRRVTLRTGVVAISANLEKTGSFVVKIANKWLVFQCTVNWARARLSLSLIAVGAAASRGS